MEKDPVCGMDVDPGRTQQKAEYQGKTYYFCGPGCRKAFEADPAKFFDPAYRPPMETAMKARPGYAANKNKVLARLRRIEGQVRGLTKMVEEERYCIDVLTQVAAAKAALESVSLALLGDHMQHCVADAIKTGDGTEKVREVSAAIGRLVRS